MMSNGKQFEIISQKGEKAPTELIEKIIEFEQLVFEYRKSEKAQPKIPCEKVRNNINTLKLRAKIDNALEEMGYNEFLF